MTLCDSMNYSPIGSSDCGILQARILEWATRPSSKWSSWPRNRTAVSGISCIGRWVLYHQCHPGSPGIKHMLISPVGKEHSSHPCDFLRFLLTLLFVCMPGKFLEYLFLWNMSEGLNVNCRSDSILIIFMQLEFTM